MPLTQRCIKCGSVLSHMHFTHDSRAMMIHCSQCDHKRHWDTCDLLQELYKLGVIVEHLIANSRSTVSIQALELYSGYYSPDEEEPS